MRLFVAIGIPADVKARLQALSGGVPGAHWSEAESYHLTLRFIGEAGRADAEEIDAQLAEIAAPAFEIELSGVDEFHTGHRPRALWAGVAPSAGLSHLARKVDRATVATGFAPETRNFTPHVTIARLRDAQMERVMRFVSEHALFRAPPFTVDHFTLFESRQGNDGPVYIPLVDYALSGTSED